MPEPIFLLLVMFGFLALLSLRARMMHKSFRDKTKRLLLNGAAYLHWQIRKAAWSVKGAIYDYYNKIRRSPRGSPKLYLPEKPFSGSLAVFLDQVAQHPAYAETIQQRLYRLIWRKGINHRRTFEIRYLYGNPRLLAFNAFNDLQEINPEVLHQFVRSLEDPRGNRILLLSGVPCSGKTKLVSAIHTLLEEGEPMVYLTGSPNRCHPLQLLYLIHSFAERYSTLPKQEAVREILDELGFSRQHWYAAPSKAFENACSDAGVPATFGGLASIENADKLAAALFALLNLNNYTRLVRRPTVWEAEILRELVWVPQDARVQSCSDGVAFARVIPEDRYCCSGELHSFNIAQLARRPLDSWEVEDWTRDIHRAHRGVLVMEEGLRSSPRTLQDLVDAANGQVRVACGEYMTWQGLIILTATDRDMAMFAQSRATAAIRDHMFRLETRPTPEVEQLERMLNERCQKLLNATNVELPPLLVPYLARFGVATTILADEPLNVADPTRRLTSPKFNDQQWRTDNLSMRLLSMVLDDVLRRCVVSSTRCADAATKPTVEQLRDAIQPLGYRVPSEVVARGLAAADEWWAEPHPVLSFRAAVREKWKEFRQRLREGVAEARSN